MKKILFNILFICISAGFLYASDTLIVTQVDQEYLIAKSNLNKVPSENQIYAVYTELTKVGDKKLPAGYIGEVYFLKNKEQELKFAYAWDGAYISIKKGFYLVPVGRSYNTEGINGNTSLNLIVEDTNKSNSAPSGNSGQNAPIKQTSGNPAEKGLISFNAGGGISMAIPTGIEMDFLNIALMLGSLRGGLFTEAALNFNQTFSLGLQAGVNYMYITDDQGNETYLVDLPARLLVNADLGGATLSIMGGYYYSLVTPFYTGIEVGGKIDLSGLYGQYTALFNEFTMFHRIELGYTISL